MKNIFSLALVAVISLAVSDWSIAQTKNCGPLRSAALQAASIVRVYQRQVDSLERQIENTINRTDRSKDQIEDQISRAEELRKQLSKRADLNIVTGVARFLFVSTRSVSSTLNNQAALRSLKSRMDRRVQGLVAKGERLEKTSQATLRRHNTRLDTANQKLARATATYESRQAQYEACAITA